MAGCSFPFSRSLGRLFFSCPSCEVVVGTLLRGSMGGLTGDDDEEEDDDEGEEDPGGEGKGDDEELLDMARAMTLHARMKRKDVIPSQKLRKKRCRERKSGDRVC